MILFAAIAEPDQRSSARLDPVRGLERRARLDELSLFLERVALIEQRLGLRTLRMRRRCTERDANRRD
jgi:hypothetical protein